MGTTPTPSGSKELATNPQLKPGVCAFSGRILDICTTEEEAEELGITEDTTTPLAPPPVSEPTSTVKYKKPVANTDIRVLDKQNLQQRQIQHDRDTQPRTKTTQYVRQRLGPRVIGPSAVLAKVHPCGEAEGPYNDMWLTVKARAQSIEAIGVAPQFVLWVHGKKCGCREGT